MKYTLGDIRKGQLIIFEAIVGSRAYGTAMPHSDTDIKGVFIQPIYDIIREGYIDQVSDDKQDTVFYEIRRFLQLLKTNNPTVLELLYAPEDCILQKEEIFDEVLKNRDKFLTKKCKDSFGGYAYQQIRKAKGYKKKINWDEQDKQRKDPLDFCFTIDYHQSYPLKKYLENAGIKQKYCGVVNVPNAPGVYALFHDYDAQCLFENFSQEERQKIIDTYDVRGYKGIVKEDENGNLIGNDIRLSSVPKRAVHYEDMKYNFYGNFFFNRDAYSSHCKKYKEYCEWLEKRNPERFRVNKEHGKKYDSKNMMHTFRLINTAIEIAMEHHINVRRSDEEIEKLMKIRKGEYEYNDLLKEAEQKITEMEEVYKLSNLPDEIDDEFIKDLTFDIRNEFESIFDN